MNISDLGASMAGFGAGIAIFLFILAFGILIMLLLEYIFQSLAFYNFMKNRNLENAFLAWIPIVSVYTIGKGFDNINELQNKKTYLGVIMLVIDCVYSAVSLLPLIIFNWGLFFALLILELICYNHLVFKTYTPNNQKYFVLTVIFSIMPIIPFIPGLCLLKASKNQPIY